MVGIGVGRRRLRCGQNARAQQEERFLDHGVHTHTSERKKWKEVVEEE
jgi:hypothetical protein